MRPDRWWTWEAERPAALVHLAAGARVTPILFSARAERAWPLAPGPDLRFGPRACDGSCAVFTTTFQDTRLAWRADLGEGGAATLSWQLDASGEWGLRYWVLLCVEAPDGVTLRSDRTTGRLVAEAVDAGKTLVITPDAPPAMTTFHASVPAVIAEIEANGYFFLGSRGVAGRVAALRFNLEQAPVMRVDLSVGGAAAPEPAGPAPTVPPEGTPQAALQAMYDVMAWNHVFDDVNQRPYTALTRFWNRRKFGGFGVWLDDVLFNGMMWSLFDADNARLNVAAVAAWQTEQGNFPCLVTGNDAWLDRSQIPVAAFVTWQIFKRTGDRDFLAWAYPRMARNNAWWRRRRSLGNQGFIAYGTSLDVGDGLYKGTKFAAKNESSMDNSPVHDPAPFDAETGLLQSFDVGLNSLYALDFEMLGHMATALGDEAAATRHRADHVALAQAIQRLLWDDTRAVFANRLLDGIFIRPIAPTSFYPLAAGAATPQQAAALVRHFLDAPDKFGGRFGLPSISRDDPAFQDNAYWRGRIWGPMNFWTYIGLRRQGLDEAATALAARGQALFDQSWRDRLCGENYNADTGAIFDQPDSDGFYAWGALLPWIAVAEVVSLDPWSGLSVTPSKIAGDFGPLATPLGTLRIIARGDAWTLAIDGAPLLAGDVAGRLGDLAVGCDELAVTLPATRLSDRIGTPGRPLTMACLDGAPIAHDGETVRLPVRTRQARLALRFVGTT